MTSYLSTTLLYRLYNTVLHDWNYKAFRVSILFEGVSKVQYFQGGRGFYPFLNESRGNLLEMVADPRNRWIPREYAEVNGIDPALAENPNAKFPRLTYGENKNNNQESTFWLADSKYLRLKNVDVSYRFTNNWLKSRVGVESATLSLIGENLHVWDKVKLLIHRKPLVMERNILCKGCTPYS